MANTPNHVFLLSFIGPYVPTNYVPVKKTMQVMQQTLRTTSVAIGTTITLRSGNNLIIKCPVSLFGQVDTFWQKDEEVFTGTRAHSDGSVFISKIMPNDAGDYICFSKDEARVKFGVVTLKVVGVYGFLRLFGQEKFNYNQLSVSWKNSRNFLFGPRKLV